MKLEYFIARKVAAGGQQSFSRLIIRIAVIAIALSISVMICANALIAGFKQEISTKIFGFWGHIHITDTDISRSILEAYPIRKDQDFYPSLDTISSVSYTTTERLFGQEVEKIRKTKGGVRHIQTFAIKPGIIEAGKTNKKKLKALSLKG
jgi:lipoprotein-releasing system permease protein